jgi:hypothetical protein
MTGSTTDGPAETGRGAAAGIGDNQKGFFLFLIPNLSRIER